MARGTDQLDRKLLALLQVNAREHVATLARKLGVARTTVQERIVRLQKNGTIQGFSVVLGRSPFDQYADGIAFITTSHRKQRSVIELLREFPEIDGCYSLSGENDLMVRIKVIQLEDMLPVIEAIEELAGVERVKSTVILATNFDHSRDARTIGDFRDANTFAKGEVG